MNPTPESIARNTNIELMRSMRASVPKWGQFFIEAGGDPNANPDKQALILIHGRKNLSASHPTIKGRGDTDLDQSEYVVITADGPKLATMLDVYMLDKNTRDKIKRLGDISFNGKELAFGNVISTLRKIHEPDMDFVNEALAISMRKSKSDMDEAARLREDAIRSFADERGNEVNQAEAMLELFRRLNQQPTPTAEPVPPTPPSILTPPKV